LFFAGSVNTHPLSGRCVSVITDQVALSDRLLDGWTIHEFGVNYIHRAC